MLLSPQGSSSRSASSSSSTSSVKEPRPAKDLKSSTGHPQGIQELAGPKTKAIRPNESLVPIYSGLPGIHMSSWSPYLKPIANIH